VNWACLAVGVVAIVLSLTSLLPPRGPVGSGLSFVPSWIVGEAPLHFAAVFVAATIGCGFAGGLTSWPGWTGVALTAIACAGLVAQFASGVQSHRCFESALAESGQVAPRWTWSAQDSRHVVVALPIRPRGVERLRDIAYADGGGRAGRAHRLDLYRKAGPERPVAAPVLLYFHGGAWVMGDKREQGVPMLGHLAERGFVCVTANYALSPRARWPRHILDCKLALVWVKQHIAEYGGDPNLVFLSGGSAGGHLAALVALTANDPVWQPGFEDEDTTVAACIPLYGVYDFVDPDRIGNANLTPILERRVFEQAAEEAFAAASPISRVSGSAPPFLVVHGRNDVLVPVQSARAFVAALRAGSTQPVAYAELPLTQHAFDNFWSPRTVHFLHALEHFTAGIISTRAAQREVGR
jgi:acetyl esterase/lipase